MAKKGTSIIVSSGPFCVNRWDRPRDEAQRDRSGASIGSDLTFPSRTARKLHPLPELPCEHRTGPAEPRHNPTTALTYSPTRWQEEPFDNSKQCPLLCK